MSHYRCRVTLNYVYSPFKLYLLVFLLQQAVQEKYRQAGENLENLNRWLEKVEREIASQEVPREDSDKLRNQINGFKVGCSFKGVFRINI